MHNALIILNIILTHISTFGELKSIRTCIDINLIIIIIIIMNFLTEMCTPKYSKTNLMLEVNTLKEVWQLV